MTIDDFGFYLFFTVVDSGAGYGEPELGVGFRPLLTKGRPRMEAGKNDMIQGKE